MWLQRRDEIRDLIERLSACPLIARYGQDEAGTLAKAFVDFEEAFRKFLEEYLPKLANPSVKGDELEDLLLDIREEFRHVLYHLHDPLFLRILEPVHPDCEQE